MKFDEARTAAATAGLDVEAYGYEDDSAFLVIETAETPVLGAGAVLVDKATGRVHRVAYPAEMDRIDAMTPVGAGHPPEDG